MRKLLRLHYFLILTLLFASACDDPPEADEKDLTVADVRSVYNALSSNAAANGRQDTLGIAWQHGRYKEISVGDALLFPLENVADLYVSSNESGVLYPFQQQAFAFAYKDEEEAVALELVQVIPTDDTEDFTGFVTVSDWNEDIKYVFYYDNGVIVTPSSDGRIEGCTTTYYWECTDVEIEGILYGHKCSLAYSNTVCRPDIPELAPDDYGVSGGGDDGEDGGGSADASNLCPHPELEGQWVSCDQYDCPYGYEAVPGQEGCQKVCPAGHTRDEYGTCVGDFDCNTTSQRLKDAFPEISDANADTLADLLNEYAKDFGIDEVEELQHFLGQANHELGGFSNLNRVESMSYSEAGLISTFPRVFDSVAHDAKLKAADYARDPVSTGNAAYGDILGNGDEASGDGYKFRGRGLFQLTGRYNYRQFNQFYQANFDAGSDFLNNPSQVASSTKVSVISALWYYKTRVLNRIEIDASTSVEDVTIKINKRKRGLENRKTKTKRAKDHIEDCIDHEIVE